MYNYIIDKKIKNVQKLTISNPNESINCTQFSLQNCTLQINKLSNNFYTWYENKLTKPKTISNLQKAVDHALSRKTKRQIRIESNISITNFLK